MTLISCRTTDRQCNSKRKGKPCASDMVFAGCMHDNAINRRKKRSKSCFSMMSISPQDMEMPSGMGRRSSSTTSFLTSGESTPSFLFSSGLNTTLSTDEEDFRPFNELRGRCLSDSNFAMQSFRSRSSLNYESDDSSRPVSVLDDLTASGSSYCFTPSKFDDFRQSPRQGVLSPIYADYLAQHASIKVTISLFFILCSEHARLDFASGGVV
jgi:hypothetical protein